MASIAPARPAPRPSPTGGVEGELVYAIGDIHGRYDLLCDMLARIAADSAERARGRRPILILCGDYVDRGPDSAKVLSTIIWLERHGPFELHALKGNHEAALLGFLDRPEGAGDWLEFGGDETLAAYGVPRLREPILPETLAAARDDLAERMPVAHLRLLQRLELMVSIGDYLFVHAGVRPGVALAEQSERDLLWIRDPFLETETRFDKMIVHGHSWATDEPSFLPHRIGIDTGAYHTGTLTAVRIEDGAVGTIQVRREG